MCGHFNIDMIEESPPFQMLYMFFVTFYSFDSLFLDVLNKFNFDHLIGGGTYTLSNYSETAIRLAIHDPQFTCLFR